MKRKKYFLFILTGLYLVINLAGSSQFVNYRFERIGTKEGLPNANVNYILQDRKGFIWFATYSGISKYDGYSFTNYLYDPKEPNGISSHIIEYLYEDSEGKIWVVNASNSGVDRYDPVYDKFVNFRHDPSDSNSLSSSFVFHVTEDNKGNIWIVTNNALNLLVKKNGKITFERSYFPDDNISTKVFHESKNNIYFLFSPQIYVFDRENNQFHPINDTRFQAANTRSYIVEDNDGNFITCTNTGLGKFKYNPEKYLFEMIDSHEFKPSIDHRNFIEIDESENIWFGNEAKGLFMFNFKNRGLLHFVNDPMDDLSLSDNRVKSLFIDKTGVLWIGTSNQGICKLDLNRNNIYHIQSIHNNPNSLSGNLITSIHGISENEIWVGLQDEGGVNRLLFDDNDDLIDVFRYKHDPDNRNSISWNDVSCLVQRKNGDVWVGFKNISVSRIIPEKPNTGKKPVIHNYDMASWTFSIFEDSDSILWGGTWGGGLWRFNDSNEEFTYYSHNPSDPNSLIDIVVWSLYEDRYKNIWIGGNSKGISILTADQKNSMAPEFINFSYEEGNPNSLSNNTVNVLFQDSQGTMWIGTSGGLVEVVNSTVSIPDITKTRSLKFKSYTMNDGLPNNNINGIVEDSNGNIWLSTISGISFFNKKDSTFTNFYESDGFQGDEYFHNSYFINSKGKIFFGGVNGISTFYPNEVKANPFVPEIMITGIKIYNKTVQIGEKVNNDVLLEKSIDEISTIVLSHKNNYITIEFAVLHYANTLQNQFAFYLEGYEKAWNYKNNVNSATYMNLKPGTYTFRVKGSNNNGIWNEKGTSLKIIVKPPFWNEIWFRGIYISLIIGIIFLSYYIRMRQVKKINKFLEQAVNERTTELNKNNVLLTAKTDELNEINTMLEERQQRIEEQTEELRVANEQLSDSNTQLSDLNSMKNKFFSIIGHDLKNPINVVIGFSQILEEKIDKMNLEKRNLIIQQIVKAARHTYELLENLLEWVRSQSGRMDYSPVIISMGRIIRENVNLLKEQAEKKKINLTFKTDITEDIVYCDEKMILTVVRNIISNAIKFTNIGGQVTIFFLPQSRKKDKLVTCIQDNGVGIPETELPKLFDLDNKYKTPGTSGENGTGLGLVLCKEFIEKNQGEIWVESTRNAGTKFYISLPLATP